MLVTYKLPNEHKKGVDFMFIKFLPNGIFCSGRVLEIALPHSMEETKNIFILFPKSKISFMNTSLSEMEVLKKIFPFEKQSDYCFSGQQYDVPAEPFFRIYYAKKWRF